MNGRASAFFCRQAAASITHASSEGDLPLPKSGNAPILTSKLSGIRRMSLKMPLTAFGTYIFRGKRPVLLSAIVLLLGMLLGVQVTGSIPGAWRWIGVPALDATFADTRTITHSIECLRSGRDPYIDTRCDPLGRLYNYPPIWLELSRFSVGPATTKFIGIFIAASAFAAFMVILSSGLPVSGALIVLSVLSPPILFGFERGNIDLLIFALLVFGIVATSRASPWGRTALRALLIISLTVLKIYPLATAAMLLRNGRGWLLSIVVAMTAGGAFLWAAYGRVGAILTNTPVSLWYSFGAPELFLRLRDAGRLGHLGRIVDASSIRWIACASALGCASLLVLGRLYLLRSPQAFEGFLPPLRRGDTSADLTVACLSVFLFCYVSGSNYAYRLIFLLGAMPVMLRHFECRPGVRTLVAPVALLVLLWFSRLYWSDFTLLGVSGYWSYLDALFEWVVFFGAVAWLAVNLLDSAIGGTNEAQT